MMSFCSDPYRRMTVVFNKDGTYTYECDSCGGGWRHTYQPSVTVTELRVEWEKHVWDSHKLRPEDTADWSS
jgi:hypothetical protein